MKPKKKDNPATLGLMAVILIGALFSVGKSLFSGEPPPAVRVTQTSLETTPVAGAAAVAVGPLPASERDPFSSTQMQRVLLQSKQSTSVTALPAEPRPTAVGSHSSIPVVPALTPPLSIVRVQPNPTAPSAVNPGAGSPSEEKALARSIRVTAIVRGANPYAVLEPTGSPPRTLHVSEMYRSMRLVAVRAEEIVLKGRSGLWTLPLATPENETEQTESRN